jgi:FAD synthetase
VIGDEVLSGKVEEQNARFLVRELRKLGVAVRRIEVIPDVPEEIAAWCV